MTNEEFTKELGHLFYDTIYFANKYTNLSTVTEDTYILDLEDKKQQTKITVTVSIDPIEEDE